MCGFAGIADPAGRLADLPAAVRRMASTMLLRGPDDEGFWNDPSVRVALGFRRLAIQDLTEGGRQPMQSPSGRYTVVFNGEIYNFKELRNELVALGHAFRGGSDTEVMLAAFESWGLEQSLRRFNGMFAIALWDARDRIITLIRDRIGVKPLYWGLIGPGNDLFAFGSELKSIDALPLPRLPIDRVALSLFVRFGYVPSPYSIRSSVHKLQPGHLLRWHHASGRIEMEQWWSAKEAAERGSRDPVTDYSEACDLVEDCVRSSVSARLVADVPVGAFLSGGIDSSLMVALAAQESSSRVKTFTIGFEDPDYNEASHAAAIAKHLGTDHTELFISPREGLEVLPLLADVFDEPFADSSAIPTYIVARLAHEQVKVGLSGDGGDELFGGYERYAVCARIERSFGWMPRALRRTIGMAAARGSTDCVGHGAVARLATLFGLKGRSSAADRLGKLAAILAAPDVDGFYPVMASIIKDPLEFVVNGREGLSPMTDPAWRPDIRCRLTRMMHADVVSYLPEEILTKTDRLTMANSLEGRDPYCDYRLAELAFRIPASMKLRGRVGKAILRDVLARHVPRSLNVGRKMGFGVPLDEWLRGPLRPWVEETLSHRRLRDNGFFDPSAVRSLWDAHLSGRRNAQWELWVFLSFSGWLDRWNAGAPASHG